MPTAGGRAGWALGLGVCLGALALPAREARAQPASTAEEEVEAPSVAPYVDRGLLYGPGQAAFTLRLRTSPDTWDGAAADVTLGLAAGITPRLSFDTSLGTIAIGPRVFYNRPDVGLWYGLVDTPPFELDATTHLAIDVGGANVFSQVEPGAVAILRAEDDVRLDVGAYFPVPLDGVRGVGFRMPISLAAQIHPDVHVAVDSGLDYASLGDQAGRTSVPLGFSIGCTVPLGGGGYAVLTPSVSWPRFLSVQTGDLAPTGPGPLVMAVSLGVVTPP